MQEEREISIPGPIRVSDYEHLQDINGFQNFRLGMAEGTGVRVFLGVRTKFRWSANDLHLRDRVVWACYAEKDLPWNSARIAVADIGEVLDRQAKER